MMAIGLIVTDEELSFGVFLLNIPGVVKGSLLWSRSALTRFIMGEMLLLNCAISDVKTYKDVVWPIVGSVSTSSSSSPMAS